MKKTQKTIKQNNYITIQAFMRNELGLKGNELLVYAIIYGFSQDGETEFKGSLSYIGSWLGTTRRQTVIAALDSLIEKGLIIKTLTAGKTNSYKAFNVSQVTSTETEQALVRKEYTTSTETEQVLVRKAYTTSTESVHNNNIYINNNNNTNKKDIEQKHKYGFYENVLLTDTELNKLKTEFNDYAKRIDELSCYMKSTGKHYSSHLATIRNWARREKQTRVKPGYCMQDNTGDNNLDFLGGSGHGGT